MRGLDRGKRREPRLPATAGSSALSCAWRGERGKRKYPVLKSSFAYCASRRRVFGSANNGGLPLSTSLSSFSLCVLFHRFVFAAHTCARSRACLQEHYCRATISRSARARETGGIQRFPERERAGRSSSITHVGPRSPITQGVPSVIHAISIHLDTVARHRAPFPSCSYVREAAYVRIRLFATHAYERIERGVRVFLSHGGRTNIPRWR